ncbi:TPR-like protein [Dendrothele bispora CBS 962.96]|uniref:TPR-like protein n=1 Tax=Dendrothele bispora (strain CBS 962.96) TaxID=1314807 RepID=A0A4V4HF62_DENBC|nr:TPR-like protein [Dendrothele bispora CBS 962.96]
MSWLGDIYFMQQRYKEAFEMISEAQQVFLQIGNELGVAECLKRLGDIYLMQGRYEEATEMLSDARKQFETFGNQLRAAECLWSLGDLYRKQEKYDEATEMTLKAQKQSEDIGDKEGVANCLRLLGIICEEQAQYNEAANMLSNAQRQYQSTLLKIFPGEKYKIGYTLLNFGHLLFDMKDFVEARRRYEEARDIFDSHGQLEKEVDYCSQALAELDEAETAGSISK